MPQYQIIRQNGEKYRVQLPFEMEINSDSEFWLRAGSFWQKEPETLNWINTFGANVYFWDIGANVGCYSLYCAMMKPFSKVLSIEPFSKNFESLKRNVILNGFTDRVLCLHVAVTDFESESTEFHLAISESGSSGGQLKQPGIKIVGSTSFENVSTTTCDKLLELHGCPHHIKIDIDGQEYACIKGMLKVLQDNTLKSVLVEQNENIADIEIVMKDAGFEKSRHFNSWVDREEDKNIIWIRP